MHWLRAEPRRASAGACTARRRCRRYGSTASGRAPRACPSPKRCPTHRRGLRPLAGSMRDAVRDETGGAVDVQKCEGGLAGPDPGIRRISESCDCGAAGRVRRAACSTAVNPDPGGELANGSPWRPHPTEASLHRTPDGEHRQALDCKAKCFGNRVALIAIRDLKGLSRGEQEGRGEQQ